LSKFEEVTIDDAGDDTRGVREKGGNEVVCSHCAGQHCQIQTSIWHAKACCWRSFNGRHTSRLMVSPRKGDSTSNS